MRFKGRLELEEGIEQIEIAPLVNIIFLLLVFLVIALGNPVAQGVKVNLPKAFTSTGAQYENIEILLSQDNSVYLNGKAVGTNDLKAFFKQVAGKKQAILLKADRRASLGKVVEVWDFARDTGITAINIATNQE